jgi:iron(III) transport system permease protein
MNQASTIDRPAAPLIKPKTSKDDRTMVGFILVICLYLLITLAFPLYAMLSKSFSTFSFDLTNFEFQVNTGEGWSEAVSAASLNQQTGAYGAADLDTSSDGRLGVVEFFPDFSFRSPTLYKIRQIRLESSFLFGSERVADTDWHEYSSNDFRRIVLRPSDPQHADHGQPGVRFRLRAEPQHHALQGIVQAGRDDPDPGAVAVARHRAGLPVRQPGHDQGPADG